MESVGYEKFNLIEIKSDDGKEKTFFIEGHISTIDPDSANDIVTEQGQDNLVTEISSKDITMDLDHESFRNSDGSIPDRDLNKIPVAKIVESKRTAIGTYVKAMLNKDHPQFKNILSSIKNGFLHSFSIAYHVKDFVKKVMNGEQFRLLNKLELRNVGITGNPVNSNATFSISLKSHIKKMEETNKVAELEKAITEMKSSLDALVNDMEARKEAEVKSKEEEKAVEESSQAEVKSLKEEMKAKDEEIAELKSKLEEPQMKGAVEQKSEVQEEAKTHRAMMSYI